MDAIYAAAATMMVVLIDVTNGFLIVLVICIAPGKYIFRFNNAMTITFRKQDKMRKCSTQKKKKLSSVYLAGQMSCNEDVLKFN